MREPHGNRALLFALVLAQFAMSSESSVVAIAAPTVAASFGGSMSDIQLINTVFGLVAGVFMITGSLLGLFFGWRKTFAAGVASVLVGEIAMVLAPTITCFTWIGRTAVGLGGALLVPSILGTIPTVFKDRQRIVAFSWVAAGMGLSALTPIPAGILLDLGGYQLVFGAMAVVFLCLLAFVRQVPTASDYNGAKQFDFPGFFVYSTGLFALLLGIVLVGGLSKSQGNQGGLPAILATALVLGGSALLCCFFLIEKRREKRDRVVLMPTRFFDTIQARHSLLAVAYVLFFSGSLNIAVIPFLQTTGAATGLVSGLLFACAGAPMVLAGILIPKLFPAASPRRVIRIGYAIGAAGFLVIAFGFGTAQPVLWTGCGTAVLGLAMGTVNSQANNAVTVAVGNKYAAQSGGMQGTVRDIAYSLSAAVLGTLLALVFSFSLPAALAEQPDLDPIQAEAVAASNATFGSDASFVAHLESVADNIDEQSSSAALGAFQQARQGSNQVLLIVLALLSAGMLLFSRGIPSSSRATGTRESEEDLIDAR